jgi:hypothetical protein
MKKKAYMDWMDGYRGLLCLFARKKLGFAACMDCICGEAYLMMYIIAGKQRQQTKSYQLVKIENNEIAWNK